MADDSQEVADIIDALGATPSPLAVYQATRNYDTRYLASAAASEAKAGGGGGSQSVRVVGPCHFDYTDFPTEDTELVVFTPDAGDFILKGFIDTQTAVNFADSGGIDFSLGEDPDFNAAVRPGTFWGFTGNSIADLTSAPVASDNIDDAIAYVGYKSTGAPLKIRAQSVLDETAGEMDLYFLVATPTAP